VAFSRYEARKPLIVESVVSDEFAATLRFIFVAGGHMMLQQSSGQAQISLTAAILSFNRLGYGQTTQSPGAACL
jgi:hypothetical protein